MVRKELEKLMLKERMRLGELKQSLNEENEKEIHKYFIGYQDAYIYYERLFAKIGRVDAMSILKKYLP